MGVLGEGGVQIRAQASTEISGRNEAYAATSCEHIIDETLSSHDLLSGVNFITKLYEYKLWRNWSKVNIGSLLAE